MEAKFIKKRCMTKLLGLKTNLETLFHHRTKEPKILTTASSTEPKEDNTSTRAANKKERLAIDYSKTSRD